MRVIKAEALGYCMGVRRAMRLAQETAANAADGEVYCLGPLIHNPQAIAALEAAGVRSCADWVELDSRAREGDTVIVRAHGLPPSASELLLARGFIVVDATCPRVKASQRLAERRFSEGALVILAGDADHGEIAGIAGHAPGCVIVSSADEASRVPLRVPAGSRATLIGQTTISRDEYDRIAHALRARISGLEVIDSICPATRERLDAVRALFAEADAIVVVGGRGSANTTRLHRAALESGKPAWHVETADELPPEIARFGTVGVTAGASTPDEQIEAVVARLRSM
jgi:4-hydroxy-3-methylbut-2-enyl diphosphate reductase